MKNLIYILLFFVSISGYAQKKKDLKKLGIKTIEVSENNGGKTFFDSKTTYDKNGEIIEDWNYDKQGNLKSILKIKYNNDSDPIEEQEFDGAKNLIEKRIFKYDLMGQKTEETFYDGSGKLIKKHIITYLNNGLKTEKKIYDGNNVLKSTKKYIYSTK